MLAADTFISRTRDFSNMPPAAEMTGSDRKEFRAAEDHFAMMVREQPNGGADQAFFSAQSRYMDAIIRFHDDDVDPEAMSDTFKLKCLGVLADAGHQPAVTSRLPFLGKQASSGEALVM